MKRLTTNAGPSTSENTNMVLDGEEVIDLELMRCRQVADVA